MILPDVLDAEFGKLKGSFVRNSEHDDAGVCFFVFTWRLQFKKNRINFNIVYNFCN